MNNYFRVSTIILILILIFVKSTNCQNNSDTLVMPSYKEISYSISCEVNQITNRDGFIYNYTINNSSISEQEIFMAFVLVYENATTVSKPSNWIGKFYPNSKKTVKWFSIDTLNQILPGNFKDNYNYYSIGYPIIGDFHCQGYAPFPVVTVDPEYVIGDDIFENSVKKRTLTSKSIPNPFNAEAFGLNLLSMGDEADSLDWISPGKDDDTWDILKSHLKSAFNNILIKNYDDAYKYLKRFLKLVDEYYEKQEPRLSVEAYALFKYNTEYLINYFQLKGK